MIVKIASIITTVGGIVALCLLSYGIYRDLKDDIFPVTMNDWVMIILLILFGFSALISGVNAWS